MKRLLILLALFSNAPKNIIEFTENEQGQLLSPVFEEGALQDCQLLLGKGLFNDVAVLYRNGVCLTWLTKAMNKEFMEIFVNGKIYHADLENPITFSISSIWNLCNSYHVEILYDFLHENDFPDVDEFMNFYFSNKNIKDSEDIISDFLSTTAQEIKNYEALFQAIDSHCLKITKENVDEFFKQLQLSKAEQISYIKQACLEKHDSLLLQMTWGKKEASFLIENFYSPEDSDTHVSVSIADTAEQWSEVIIIDPAMFKWKQFLDRNTLKMQIGRFLNSKRIVLLYPANLTYQKGT